MQHHSDSVQALAPLATGRNVCSAALKGAVWGLGHSMGQLALGLFMVLFKVGFQNVSCRCMWQQFKEGCVWYSCSCYHVYLYEVSKMRTVVQFWLAHRLLRRLVQPDHYKP